MIKGIVAWETKSRGIGYQNQLPWPIVKEDMAHFRSLTVGHAVVMGAETFRSLGNIALPKRKNIVLTRKKRKEFPADVIQITDASQLLKLSYDLWVIGGRSVYSLLLDVMAELYVTELKFDITHKIVFDRYFPSFNESHWDIKGSSSPFLSCAVPGVQYRILKYRRNKWT